MGLTPKVMRTGKNVTRMASTPPPPLNGTAHAWHHPRKALIYTIKNGTQAIGGNMPAWKDKLTDDEIESIILWFQSKWPDELYQAWAQRDQAS